MNERPEAKLMQCPEDVDLTRHAVIEASAGTGKTWTIEQLVARMVSGDGDSAKGLDLRQILVVTFTERAAGEMRDRIRATLVDLAKDKPELRAWLESCLSAFDEAMITTIHGFCRRVLSEYALECGLPGSPELVDDTAVHSAMLRRIYRDWLADPGQEVLARLAGFSDDPERYQKNLLRLAGLEDVVPPGEGPVTSYDELPGLLELINKEFVYAMQLLKPFEDEIDRLCQVKTLAGHHGTYYTRIRTSWLVIRECLAVDLERLSRQDLAACMLQIHSAVVEKGSDFKGYQKQYHDLTGACVLKVKFTIADCAPDACWPGIIPCLDEVIDHLETVREGLAEIRRSHLYAVAERVRRMARDEKAARDQYSYNDMIRLVRHAVERPGRGLTARLRERYRVAMIDEFQDTDLAQWEIFRQVFAESDEGHTLCLIGDPKQAIYGFRGGDVATYFSARSYLVERKGARVYTLGTNWRSNTAMVQACNALFASTDDGPVWFLPHPGSGEAPDFLPSDVPKQPRNDWAGPASPDPIVVQEIGRGNAAANRFAAAGWIADRIGAILRGALPEVRLAGTKEARPLGAGDIAILVRAKGEAEPVLRVLRARRIPCTFYKAGGLWRSPEALAVVTLFDALALGTPQAIRLALLGPFFRTSPGQLEAALPAESRERALLERWRELALARDWPALCMALERESGVHEGLRREGTVGEPARTIDQRDDERRSANLRQILSGVLLAPDAGVHGLEDIAALVRRRYKQAEGLAEDEDIQPLESDGGKVRIMTMHAAKGLQFPVVFIAGGFSEFPKSTKYFEYYNENGKKVFDHLKTGEGKTRAHGYWQGEMQRLFYVALTRAMLQLNIPIVTDKSLSPDITLATLAGLPLRAALESCRERDIPGIVFGDSGTEAVHQKQEQEGGTSSQGDRAALARFERPLPEKNSFKELMVDSFTGLAAVRHTLQTEPDPDATDPVDGETCDGEIAGYKMDDEKMEELPEAEIDPPELDGLICLPRGVESGTLVHGLFEQVDFGMACRDRECRREGVQSILQRSRIRATRSWMDRRFPGWNDGSREEGIEHSREELADWLDDLVESILTTPIGCGERELVLGSLEWQDTLREVRFDERTPFSKRKYYAPLVTGSIDLLFRFGGKYYVLDWKTNWLEDYSAQGLAVEMDKHGYDLQAAIYGAAVRRWLVSRGLAADEFGGALYLFVRAFSRGGYAEVRDGGAPRAADGAGVLFFSGAALEERADRYGMNREGGA